MIDVHASHQDLGRTSEKTKRIFIAQVLEDGRPVRLADRTNLIASQVYYGGDGADEAERRAFSDLRRLWLALRPGSSVPSCLRKGLA